MKKAVFLLFCFLLRKRENRTKQPADDKNNGDGVDADIIPNPVSQTPIDIEQEPCNKHDKWGDSVRIYVFYA